jgi:transposase
MKITTLQLTDSEKHDLEIAYKTGDSHCYRTRCKAILLKSQGKSANEIASILDVSIPSVFNWIKRYGDEGINGLKTRTGRGRKPIIDSSDEEIIRKAIEEDRQNVSKAREAWQNATGKKASDATLKRFLSYLVQDISE